MLAPDGPVRTAASAARLDGTDILVHTDCYRSNVTPVLSRLLTLARSRMSAGWDVSTIHFAPTCSGPRFLNRYSPSLPGATMSSFPSPSMSMTCMKMPVPE